MRTCAHLCPQHHPAFPPLLCSFNSCTLSVLGLVLSYTIRCQAAPFSSLPLRSFRLGWGPHSVNLCLIYLQAWSKSLHICRSSSSKKHLALLCQLRLLFCAEKEINYPSGFIHRSSIPLFSTFNPVWPSPNNYNPSFQSKAPASCLTSSLGVEFLIFLLLCSMFLRREISFHFLKLQQKEKKSTAHASLCISYNPFMLKKLHKLYTCILCGAKWCSRENRYWSI